MNSNPHTNGFIERVREILFFMFCCIGWPFGQFFLRTGIIVMRKRWKSLRPTDAFIAFNIAGKVFSLLVVCIALIFYYCSIYTALFISLFLILASIVAYERWLTRTLDKALVEQKHIHKDVPDDV